MKQIRLDLIDAIKSGRQENARNFFESMRNVEYDAIDVRKEIFFKMFIMLINLSLNDCVLTREIFDFIKGKYPDKMTENIYTALIRSYCDAGLSDNAHDIYLEALQSPFGKPHLRTYTFLFSQQRLTSERFLQYYAQLERDGLEPTIPLCESMVVHFKNVQRLRQFLEWISEYHYAIPSPGFLEKLQHNSLFLPKCSPMKFDPPVSACGFLQILDVTDDQRKMMLNHLKHAFPSYPKIGAYLNKKHYKYDVVIDGANVAMFNNTPFSAENLKKMCQHFVNDTQERVLVVLSEVRKRRDTLELANLSPLIDVFWCPRDVNDDYFWLFVAMYQNCKFVTADKMGDHVYHVFSQIGRHVFQKWVDAHHVNYSFTYSRDNRDNKRRKQKEGRRNFERGKVQMRILRPARYSTRISTQPKKGGLSFTTHIPIQVVKKRKGKRNDQREIQWFCLAFGDSQFKVDATPFSKEVN